MLLRPKKAREFIFLEFELFFSDAFWIWRRFSYSFLSDSSAEDLLPGASTLSSSSDDYPGPISMFCCLLASAIDSRALLPIEFFLL